MRRNRQECSSWESLHATTRDTIELEGKAAVVNFEFFLFFFSFFCVFLFDFFFFSLETQWFSEFSLIIFFRFIFLLFFSKEQRASERKGEAMEQIKATQTAKEQKRQCFQEISGEHVGMETRLKKTRS